MDDNPPGAQVPQEKMQRLEEDLSSLKSEEATGLPATPPQPAPPAAQVAPTTPEVTVAPIAQATPPPEPEIPTKKSNKILWLGVGLLLLSLVLVGGYLVVGRGLLTKKTACTMEAKVCPDGTSVGRVGPDCEFAPCPTPSLLPTMEPTPEVSPSASPSASPSGSPSASPSASPTATPAL